MNSSMVNFEKETIEFLNELPLELRERLIEIIEWEKELSWSNGYADAEEQLEESIWKESIQMGIGPK